MQTNQQAWARGSPVHPENHGMIRKFSGRISADPNEKIPIFPDPEFPGSPGNFPGGYFGFPDPEGAPVLRIYVTWKTPTFRKKVTCGKFTMSLFSAVVKFTKSPNSEPEIRGPMPTNILHFNLLLSLVYFGTILPNRHLTVDLGQR